MSSPAYANDHSPPLEGAVRDRVKVGGQPFRSHYLEDRGLLVVTNARGFVSFIDVESRQVIGRTRSFSQSLFDSVVTRDKKWLIAWPTLGNRLHFVSLETLKYEKSVGVGQNPGDAALSLDGSKILATAIVPRRVTAVDLEDQSVVQRFKLPKSPGAIARSPVEDVFAVSTGIYKHSNRPRGHNILLFDFKSGADPRLREVTSLDAGRHTRGLVFDRSGRWVLAANRLDNSVTIVDPKEGVVVGEVDVERGPERIKNHPVEDFAAVINRSDSSVSFVGAGEGEKLHLLKTIHLSGKPWDIAWIDQKGRWAAVPLLGRSIKTRVSLFRIFSLHILHGVAAQKGEVRDAMAFVDTWSGEEVDVFKTSKGPVHVEVHPKGEWLAVSCAIDGVVDFVE